MSDIQIEPQAPRLSVETIQAFLGPMRPRFLTLAVVCVFLGLATALSAAHSVSVWQVVLTFVGGVMAHISVNSLNEYCDYRSGLDLRTTRTPFSGGTGTIPAYPWMAPMALWIGVVSLAITAAIGVVFLALHGMALLPIGLLGLVVIVLYTPSFTHQPALCLIAPGLGFGTLMVVGTQVALTGHSTAAGWIASLVPFFLVNNLLLLNQFPDVEPDRSVGRYHVLIALGRKKCSVIYVAFLAATYASIVAAVALKYLPHSALLGMLTLALAIPTSAGVLRYHSDIPRLTPYLGMNVVLNLATPVLLAVGLLIA